ncbi:MAG: hypothetical protein R3E66_16500 [bacterium]
MQQFSIDALKEMPWWGDFQIAMGDTHHWRIGTLSIWVEGREGEWRVHHARGSEPLDEHAQHTINDGTPTAAASIDIGVSGRAHDLQVVPLLADRDVVARPETTTMVIQQDTTAFFVTTPLFVALRTPEGRTLLELPTYRPSDTWFGDTIEGELCYASRVAAYTSLTRMTHVAARVATKVSVRNLLPGNLTLERLRIPTPNLSLYVDDLNNFWTQDITITVGNDEPPHIRIDAGPPSQAVAPRMVCGPRIEGAGNILVRAFSRLLG